MNGRLTVTHHSNKMRMVILARVKLVASPGTPGRLTIGLASQRAGSITDQPPIIPRPAPRTRETGSPPALSRSEALVRETREPRVRIRLPPAGSQLQT